MLNVELMKRLRTRFLRMKHPKHFDMKVIAVKTDCGAQMCIAGHTLELAGYKRKRRSAGWSDGVLDFDFISPSGRKVRPLTAAARELGLRYYANGPVFRLFHDWSLTTPAKAAARIQELIDSADSSRRRS